VGNIYPVQNMKSPLSLRSGISKLLVLFVIGPVKSGYTRICFQPPALNRRKDRVHLPTISKAIPIHAP